jgi:hypothetical protein
MRMWFAVLVLVIGGCNKLFDLEYVDPNKLHDGGAQGDSLTGDSLAGDSSESGCVDPSGFDEDSDGLDDACDGCPTISSTAEDDDGDGLPNECDSSMTTAEEIKAYWSFSGSTSSSSLAFTANTVIDNKGQGSLAMGAGASMKTNNTYLPSRIEVLVRAASATALTGKLTVALPTLVACEVVASACGANTSATCATVVPSPNGGAMLGTPISALRKVVFHEAGTVRCTASNGSASVTAVGASLFASSQIEIATNGQLAIFVDSLVIYGLK